MKKAPGSAEVPHVSPMRPLCSGLWRWRILVASQWRQYTAVEHINKLELRSVLTALRWRARQRSRQRQRCLHLLDSMVSIGVINRARSSSRDLQYVADKINCTVLAGGLRVVLAHVASADNPADAPSRQRFRRGRAGADPAADG